MSIIVYSTPQCPYCKKVKEYFEEKGVEYEDINVAENQKKQQEMIEKSDQMGVPVIDIDGEVIIGYDKTKIDEALDS